MAPFYTIISILSITFHVMNLNQEKLLFGKEEEQMFESHKIESNFIF